MSHCEDKGKDKVIFLTPEDADPETSKVNLAEIDPSESGPQGLVSPDGQINWNCPCLGGMAVGPCGVEFREAFSCFHYSEEEPKGSDCLEKFMTMQECMKQHPDLYDEHEKPMPSQEDEGQGQRDEGQGQGESIQQTAENDQQVESEEKSN